MNSKLVSIIVPIYKVEKYIKECIDSIVNQTYKNLEIILVDDGSPDNCGKICDDYAEEDNRIKVIHKENGGLSSARNAGLDIAKGEYISFIDSDDVISVAFIENLLKSITKYNTDIAMCKSTLYKENLLTDVDINNTSIIDKKTALHNMYARTQFSTEYIVVWNKLYKKTLFDDIRFPEGKINEDTFVSYKLLWKSENGVANINKRLYFYRVRSESIMHQKFAINKFDILDSYEEQIDFFKKEDKSFIDEVENNYQGILIDLWFKTYLYIDENKDFYLKSLTKRTRKIAINIIFNSKIKIFKKIIYTMFNISPKLCYYGKSFLKWLKLVVKCSIFLAKYCVYKLFNFNKREYILLGLADHDNIGDHAITIGERAFLEDKKIKALEIDSSDACNEKLVKFIANIVSNNAVVCVTGGGFVGSMYGYGKDFIKNTLSSFKENKIIFLPQSIFYANSEVRRRN